MSLLASPMGDDVVTIDEYIEHSRMDLTIHGAHIMKC